MKCHTLVIQVKLEDGIVIKAYDLNKESGEDTLSYENILFSIEIVAKIQECYCNSFPLTSFLKYQLCLSGKLYVHN